MSAASAGPAWCVPFLRTLAEAVRDDLPADRLVERIRERRPRGAPSTLDALLAALSSLLARDARAALDRLLVATPPLPPPVEEGLFELAVIALLRGREARGQKALDPADAARLELLAATPARVPERVRNAVGRALVEAGRAIGALDVLSGAAPVPETRAHRAAALALLGRGVEARVERAAALAAVLAAAPTSGAPPAWFPGVLAPLAAAHVAPAALEALLARVRTRFPDATLAERLQTVVTLAGSAGGSALDAALRYLRSGPAPDPLAIAAAAALGKRPPAALEILDRLPDPMRAGREAQVDEVSALALHLWLDQRAPERARPYLERRLGRALPPPDPVRAGAAPPPPAVTAPAAAASGGGAAGASGGGARGGDAVWELFAADLDEQRVPGSGRARAEALLARAAGDARASAECADVLMRMGDVPLAVRFLRQVSSLAELVPLEAARAVACALGAGEHARAWRLLRERLAREDDDDARLSLLAATLSLVLDGDLPLMLPECEELAQACRALTPRDPTLARAVADLAAAGWGQDRAKMIAADRAFQVVRAHEASLTDRWLALERRWLGEVLRGVIEGAEVSTKDPALAPRRPATANRVVRQALVAYAAAHLPGLAPPGAPVTFRRRRRARTG